MGDRVVFMGDFPRCPLKGKVWQGAWKVAPVDDFDSSAPEPQKILPGWNDGTWDGNQQTGYTWKPDLEGLLIGPGTGWVGPMTKEQAMQITWRIKEWKLEVEGAAASATAIKMDYSVNAELITHTVNLDTGGEKTYERDQDSEAAAIVCGPSIFLGKVTGVDVSGYRWQREPGWGTVVSASAGNGWPVDGGRIAVDIDKPDTETNRYYVQIAISFNIFADAYSGPYGEVESRSRISLTNQQSYGVFFSSYYRGRIFYDDGAKWIVSPGSIDLGEDPFFSTKVKIDITEPSGVIKVKLKEGTELTLKAQKIKAEWAVRANLKLCTTSTSVSSLTLSPHKWWPYAKEDGSPAYDEDTGDPL